jgi:acyl-CoA thioester hydrolase
MTERKAPSTRSEFVHFDTMTTRWNDNDIFGHMNNSIHYALFDSAVNRWLFKMTKRDPRLAENVGLVVHSSCDYYHELAYPNSVVIGLRVEQIGSSSVTYRVAIFSEDSTTCAAEGSFVHVYVNRETKRPVRIDSELRAALSSIVLKPTTAGA